MMFTPTKWTHHFGVFAGLAGLGGVGRGGHHRHGDEVAAQPVVFAAAVLFVMALSFATVNGWWYVSNPGCPGRISSLSGGSASPRSCSVCR